METNNRTACNILSGFKDAELILVADDSPTARKVTSSVLLKNGYNVVQVEDGEMAIEETLKQKPSAIVVDLKMPKKNGYEVCYEIKKQKDIYFPTLLLTAREDTESMVQGLESGADDYIIKPFNEMEFIARIRVLLRMGKLNNELLSLNKKLKYLSNHDEMTGLYNHRFFVQKLDSLMKTSKSETSNLCLAMFDIDHFKTINDTFGHLEGDNVLKKVAELIESTLKTAAIIARYGGEEFAVIFDNRSLKFAVSACEEVITKCRKLKFFAKNTSYFVTISGGVACTDFIKNNDSEGLIQAADQLLYSSKKTGRNKLSFSNSANNVIK